MLVVKDKKKFKKGITIIISIVLLIVIIIYRIIFSITNKKEEKKETIDINEKENTIQVSVSYNQDIINQWNLKLVNNTESVDRQYVPELEEYGDNIKVDKRIMPYLKDMINDMNKAKITKIWIQSGYRSYEKQEELFNAKVEYYKEQGKAQEEAKRLAQQVVQRPEMSEHNLGLAVDLNTVTNEFENTKAFEWLKENAHKYGFILRYPKDKQEITKITYESWHWRYVGKEHATVMKQNNYCLEEYIDYLKNTQQV